LAALVNSVTYLKYAPSFTALAALPQHKIFRFR